MSTELPESEERRELPASVYPNIPREVVFDDLADGQSELIIEHHGQKYRLRATRNGRLILNK